jgi:DNA processing protein
MKEIRSELNTEIEATLLLNVLSPSRTKPIADRILKGDLPSLILNEIEVAQPNVVAETRKKFNVQKEFQDCLDQEIELIVLTDDRYPFLLKIISDPPLVLYVRGKLLESDKASVALVGARKPSHYGLMQARRFGCELANAGWTVVSGLAKGIDAAAHEGALSVSYGRTIAVLGCGIDVIYPSENRNLYESIEKKGAVISEFPLKTPPLAYHFPRRNRIISGLSLGTLVLEAFLRSGSLITAQQSMEQGREVFALPGKIDELTSMGTNQLIKDGATLINSIENLNEELVQAFNKWNFKKQPYLENTKKVIPLNDEVKALPKVSSRLNAEIKDSLLKDVMVTGVSLDELVCKSAISSSEVSLKLIQLELQRKIVRKADGLYYSLN